MSDTKIDVREVGGKVVQATIRLALGPWPLKNWSWGGVYCSSLESAKCIRDQIEALPTYALKREAFIRAQFGEPLDEESVRKSLQKTLKRKKATREYSI